MCVCVCECVSVSLGYLKLFSNILIELLISHFEINPFQSLSFNSNLYDLMALENENENENENGEENKKKQNKTVGRKCLRKKQ